MSDAASERAAVSAINHVPSLTGENLGAGMIGNVLEWYDFGLYGYLAPVIAQHFFPAEDPTASLMGAYGGFAIGFAMRPIGGAVLGHMGDRIGRRAVLVTSVVLMGAATTLIAFLPTYQQIGIWAPILLLVIRLFQGFSVGGEFTGSVCFLVETAPANRRGVAGSMANIGSTFGYLLAAAVATGTVMLSSRHPQSEWMWRLPFVAGGVLAMLAYWLRGRLTRTGYQPPGNARPQWPLRQAFKQAPRAMILAMLFTWGYGVVNYLTIVFLPAFASRFGTMAEADALGINTLGEGVAILTVAAAGWLTDRVIRRRTMLVAAFVMTAAAALPFFALSSGPSLLWFAVAQLGFAALLGLVMGSAPAMMVELFASRFRLSGYSLAFNVGLGFGGGTAPLIATALIGASGNVFAAPAYLMAGALLAAGALALMPDRSREPLL